MNTRIKRNLVIVGVLVAIFLVIAGWTTTQVVACVRDLPNRFTTDGDAIANSLGQAATESYHLALRGGDKNTRMYILNEQFAPLIRQHAEGAAWIRNEYGDDLATLVDSDDPAVSAAVSNLISMLDNAPQIPDGG